AAVHFQFPATGTPQTAVRLLRAFEQQHVIALVEAIKQRGDFVGQNHQTEFQISSAECRAQKQESQISIATRLKNISIILSAPKAFGVKIKIHEKLRYCSH